MHIVRNNTVFGEWRFFNTDLKKWEWFVDLLRWCLLLHWNDWNGEGRETQELCVGTDMKSAHWVFSLRHQLEPVILVFQELQVWTLIWRVQGSKWYPLFPSDGLRVAGDSPLFLGKPFTVVSDLWGMVPDDRRNSLWGFSQQRFPKVRICWVCPSYFAGSAHQGNRLVQEGEQDPCEVSIFSADYWSQWSGNTSWRSFCVLVFWVLERDVNTMAIVFPPIHNRISLHFPVILQYPLSLLVVSWATLVTLCEKE